ncbi:MAG: hypothetical protein WCT16_03070 [Candidatus Buchananbacteria bacterium]
MAAVLTFIGVLVVILTGIFFPRVVGCIVVGALTSSWPLAILLYILVIPAYFIDDSEKSLEEFMNWLKKQISQMKSVKGDKPEDAG